VLNQHSARREVRLRELHVAAVRVGSNVERLRGAGGGEALTGARVAGLIEDLLEAPPGNQIRRAMALQDRS
jgi:hypothetical protein